MKQYQLESCGNLLLTRAAVSGRDGIRVLKLLVDTGSTYTILPFEILEAVGCTPSLAREKVSSQQLVVTS